MICYATSCSKNCDVNASLKLYHERFDDAGVVGSKPERLLELHNRKTQRERLLEQRHNHSLKKLAL